MCSNVDDDVETVQFAAVIVVVTSEAKYFRGSRRLNISRETSALARLAIISAALAMLMILMMYLHVRHRGWNPARYFLDDDMRIQTRLLSTEA